MGTRGLFVLRIKGKLVLHVWLSHDMMPGGVHSRDVAKLLLELFGEVQVHSLIITIAAILKQRVGSIFLEPLTTSHLTDFFDTEYEYVIDFNECDDLVISVIQYDLHHKEIDSKAYDIAGFASVCGLDVKLPHTMPTLKFGAPLEGKEFIQMVNGEGKPLFFMAAKNWYNAMSHFVLNVNIHMGHRSLRMEQLVSGGGFAAQMLFLHDPRAINTKVGEGSSGIQCLAAQILKKTKEVCGDDAFILSEISHDAMPVHTIACYGKSTSDIGFHDSDEFYQERYYGTPEYCVQGIHTRALDRVVVRKGRYFSREEVPSVCPVRYYWHPLSPSFITWVVGSSRNRSNWQITSVSQLRNVLRLITQFSKTYAPPRPTVVKRKCKMEGDEGGGKKIKISVES